MIIKTIALSSALAACPVSPAQRPVVHALRAPSVPVQSWPEPEERPERTEPPHGEGSGESPMYVGLVANGTATISNVNAHVMVDSSASGTQPYASVAWLPNNFPLVVSTQDFNVVEPFVPPMPHKVAIQSAPDTTKHLSNPSTVQTRRVFTRRRY